MVARQLTPTPPHESYYDAIEGIMCVETSTRVLHSFPADGFRMCVTGGRLIDDLGYVWGVLDTLHNLPADMGGHGPITELGAGCARGVDRLALLWADRNGVPWRRYCADWDRFGPEAGALRNGAMLTDFKPVYLAVYEGGTGTTNCARQARKLTEKGSQIIERGFFPLGLDPFEDATKWG